jgi:TonB-linked SusC/RagA family outer membrane protein
MKKNLSHGIVLLLLSLFSFSSVWAQDTKTVTGIVSDEKGATLPGATVATTDGKHTVTTDVNGKYSITVPANTSVLSISFVGMETQRVGIGKNNSTAKVVMKSVATSLSDVVVIGYGTVRKKDATGAVASLKRDDLVKDAPTNVLQAIQGKAAGVVVTQNDGAPGAGISIRIRGSNSFLGGTEPLYVIDGVPFNNSSSGSTPVSIGGDEKQTLNALSFLNPNDIESIDILKDASATAIYGSRGANGVVLITTRRGRTGKDKVEFNLTMGMMEVSKTIKMLDAVSYATYQNLAYTNANLYGGANYTPDQFPYPGMTVNGPNGPYYKSGPSDYVNRSKNWQDEIFRTGMYQNYSINISGGNDAGNHSLSFNYLKQEGVIDHSDFTRFGTNLNLNRNIGKYFKAGTSTSLNYSITNGVKTGTDKSDDANAGVIRAAITYPSTIDSVQTFGDAKASGSQGYFITNPSIYVRDVLNKVSGVNIFSSNYFEATILKHFKLRQNIGFNYATGRRDQYYPRSVYEGFGVNGWGLKSDDIWNSIISETMLSYGQSYKKHNINAFVGSTFERTNGQWKRVEAQNFTSDLLQNENLEAGQTKMPIISDRYQSTLISFLGRVNYDYDNRYLLTFSVRRDGSSKFGKNNKWATFPSVAFAWKLFNESFIQGKIKYLSDLKLRLSYGQTGNQGIGSYASLSKLKAYKYPFGGTLQTGYADDYFSGPANPNLKWETTSAFNAGLDLGFFSNRLVLHIDGYQKRTKDLLQYLTTPLSSGFPKKLVNAGTVENKGLEIALEATPVRMKHFEWSTNFNISFNRNKIITLGADVDKQFAGNISTGDAPFVQMAGQPIGAIYGYVEDGYYDNEAEVRNDPKFAGYSDAQVRKMIGEIKYKDLDGDPTALTSNDRTVIGNVNPKYSFGFTNNFRYKHWDLSIFINAVQGNDIINMNSRFNASPGDFKNISQEMYDGLWAEGRDNSNATGPKVWRTFERDIKFTRRFIEDGSFVRLKNITLGYTVPTKLLGIQNLKVSAGINNLFTITRYSGYDPEINSYGDNPALYGVDLGGYPNARSYNVTVRCNF